MLGWIDLVYYFCFCLVVVAFRRLFSSRTRVMDNTSQPSNAERKAPRSDTSHSDSQVRTPRQMYNQELSRNDSIARDSPMFTSEAQEREASSHENETMPEERNEEQHLCKPESSKRVKGNPQSIQETRQMGIQRHTKHTTLDAPGQPDSTHLRKMLKYQDNEINELKKSLSGYMDDNYRLTCENDQLLAKSGNKKWVDYEGEYEAVIQSRRKMETKKLPKVIQDLQKLFDDTISEMHTKPKRSNKKKGQPKPSSERCRLIDARTLLSELLQIIFNQGLQIYLDRVEVAAKIMTNERKDKVVRHLNNNPQGFHQRVKYLYQGLLTVGHQRTHDEERQAALLYPDVEKQLSSITKDQYSTWIAMAEVLRSKRLDDTVGKSPFSNFTQKAIELCWTLLTSAYNPPVLDTSDIFYDGARHDVYDSCILGHDGKVKHSIAHYVFPTVFLIHPEGTSVCEKGKVLL